MNKKSIPSFVILALIVVIGGVYYLGVQKSNQSVTPAPTLSPSPTAVFTAVPSSTPNSVKKLNPKPGSAMSTFANKDFSLEYPSNWYNDNAGTMLTDEFSITALPDKHDGSFESAEIQASGPIYYENSLDSIIHDWTLPTYGTTISLLDFNTSFAQGKKVIVDDKAHKGSEKDTVSTVIALSDKSKYYILHMIYDQGDAQADYFQSVLDQIAKSFTIK